METRVYAVCLPLFLCRTDRRPFLLVSIFSLVDLRILTQAYCLAERPFVLFRVNRFSAVLLLIYVFARPWTCLDTLWFTDFQFAYLPVLLFFKSAFPVFAGFIPECLLEMRSVKRKLPFLNDTVSSSWHWRCWIPLQKEQQPTKQNQCLGLYWTPNIATSPDL